MKPVGLSPLDPLSANMVYNSALDDAGEIFGTIPSPVPLEAMEAWVQISPENRKALFIVAAAVRNAMYPNDPAVDYRGREVIEKLAEREIDRLRAVSRGRSHDSLAFARVLAMACIAGRLTTEEIQKQSEAIGFAAGVDIEEELRSAGIVSDGSVHAPTPDILAAGFLVAVFSRKPRTAPKLLWLSLEDDPAARLARIGRLSHDAEVVLGMYDHRLSVWLRDAVNGNLDRCKLLEPTLAQSPLPTGLTACAVACNRTLLSEDSGEHERRGMLLNNLSNQLSDSGDIPGALEAIREAVDIYRRLAEANPPAYEPDLAMSLNNLSNRLSDSGDIPGALEAIREAVDIRRRLAEANPPAYEPVLARSLGTYGLILVSLERFEEATEQVSHAIRLIAPYTRQYPTSPSARLLTALEKLREMVIHGHPTK